MSFQLLHSVAALKLLALCADNEKVKAAGGELNAGFGLDIPQGENILSVHVRLMSDFPGLDVMLMTKKRKFLWKDNITIFTVRELVQMLR
jgi:hypothetical protein